MERLVLFHHLVPHVKVEFLNTLRQPKQNADASVPESFRAKLRPYQKTGFAWLSTMSALGFGACLADDMGLGKTVQVLCWLEKLRCEKPEARVLLIVPASLIGNWEKEKERFAPASCMGKPPPPCSRRRKKTLLFSL